MVIMGVSKKSTFSLLTLVHKLTKGKTPPTATTRKEKPQNQQGQPERKDSDVLIPNLNPTTLK